MVAVVQRQTEPKILRARGAIPIFSSRGAGFYFTSRRGRFLLYFARGADEVVGPVVGVVGVDEDDVVLAQLGCGCGVPDDLEDVLPGVVVTDGVFGVLFLVGDGACVDADDLILASVDVEPLVAVARDVVLLSLDFAVLLGACVVGCGADDVVLFLLCVGGDGHQGHQGDDCDFSHVRFFYWEL